jgi:anti-sigma regulatory factor (Ser/Thr protein kinase)
VPETDASEILLRVPARAPYARIVRVGAAALALRQGMGFGEIDDLRLAIDEAMIVLLDGLGEDIDVDIAIVFRLTDGRFELEATREGGHVVGDAAVHRFDAIASELVDDYDVDPERGWLRLRKTPADTADEPDE